MIAFIGVRMSWDMVERKSVFARFADAASFAAACNFLLNTSMTAISNTNRISSPAETTPISSQFSAFTLRPFIGMKQSSVQPSEASTGV